MIAASLPSITTFRYRKGVIAPYVITHLFCNSHNKTELLRGISEYPLNIYFVTQKFPNFTEKTWHILQYTKSRLSFFKIYSQILTSQ